MIITLHGIENSKKDKYIASFVKNAEKYNFSDVTVGFDEEVSNYKRVCMNANLEVERDVVLFASAVAIDLEGYSINPVELELPLAEDNHKMFLAIYSSMATKVLELAKNNVDEAVNYLQLGEEEEQEEEEEDLPIIKYHPLRNLVAAYKL